MSSLPPRNNTQQSRSKYNNNNNNNNNIKINYDSVQPLRQHVNVYSTNRRNEASGDDKARNRNKPVKNVDLVAQMNQLDLGVGCLNPSAVDDQSCHIHKMQNILSIRQSALDRRAQPSIPTSTTEVSKDLIRLFQLQQAQQEIANNNPQLQAYMALAQGANLYTQPQQLEAEKLSQTHTSATSALMPKSSSSIKSNVDRGALAAKVQARAIAREEAQRKIAQSNASSHSRSTSLASNSSSSHQGNLASIEGAASTSTKSTPFIRFTPPVRSPEGHFAEGLGRPPNRIVSGPPSASARLQNTTTPGSRSVSLPSSTRTVRPIRQPNGPPAPAAELGDRNFQSCLRKKAGMNLGLLGRRVEKSS